MTLPTRPQTPTDASAPGPTEYHSGRARVFTPTYSFGTNSGTTICDVAPAATRLWKPKGGK